MAAGAQDLWAQEGAGSSALSHSLFSASGWPAPYWFRETRKPAFEAGFKFRLAPDPPIRKGSFTLPKDAGVAQRQSSCFVNSRLRVRFLSPAPASELGSAVLTPTVTPTTSEPLTDCLTEDRRRLVVLRGVECA
jgi:hypothetical protein